MPLQARKVSHSEFAVFIEPSGQLLTELIYWKSWLESNMPGQPLTLAPPHCTIIHGNYRHVDEWLPKLQEAISLKESFKITTDAWQEFPRDTLTKGGHTIAYRVKKSRALIYLQKIVANVMASYCEPVAKHPLLNIKPYHSSLKKFGSPFVGKHWIPHFTIGSPLLNPDSTLLQTIKKAQTRYQFWADAVSVWSTQYEKHEIIQRFNFKNKQKLLKCKEK